jgi:murein peptide amidase A
MSESKAQGFDVRQFAASFDSAATRAGFQQEAIGAAEDMPIVAYTKLTSKTRPRIYLSAGMHGDEPVPPIALLRMVEDGVFDNRAAWILCPMLNPSGLARGTRENSSGIDLNRDYLNPTTSEIRAHVAWLCRQQNFDLAINIHEDWEAKGFYLYELNPDRLPSLAEIMIGAVRQVCPIDPSPLIDGREAKGGIIRPEVDPVKEMKAWPETVYLGANNTRLAYTIESPSSLSPKEREAALRAALTAAIAAIASR